MTLISEQVERRLRATGYCEPKRSILRSYRKRVDAVIDTIVARSFSYGTQIHPGLKTDISPLAQTLYPASADHFRLIFEGEFDARYHDSMERLCTLERTVKVGTRSRVAVATALLTEIVTNSRAMCLFAPGRFRRGIEVIENVLVMDINTAMTVDREIDAAEAVRRSMALDTAAHMLKSRIESLDVTIDDTVQQFVATASETAAATDFIHNHVAEVTRASITMRDRALQTAAATEEMSTNIAEIGQRARQSLSITTRAVVDADAMNSAIAQLHESTARIGAVLGLISDIAAQTNLLALNATIEAARAGDAGRGFAVVASEVKALATQTAGATSEIARQVTEFSQSAQACGRHAASISMTISEIRGDSEAISDSVAQQSLVTTGIARDAADVAGSSAEAIAGAKAVSDSLVATARAIERANLAASEIALQVGAAEATVSEAMAALRRAS